MTVLIKQASIISPSSPFNGTIKDIFIENGMIVSIADQVSKPADQVIDEQGLCVSIGWMDIFADFCDPGYEFRETLETGAAAAAAGGFTDVLVIPNTSPSIHSKSQVDYILQRSRSLPVNIYPLGAITKNTEGKELAEMYDMRQTGAIAFSDGTKPVQSPGILLKALQYVKAFNGVLVQLPCDRSIGAHGLVNEGVTSTRLGLPGIPAIAEELMIARDIELLRYTGSALHITGVSTEKGLNLISQAKKEGLNITCSIAPYQVIFCDEDIAGYDTNLKLEPPLRSRKDMMAMRQALINGEIDCIASHHLPHNWDSKTCEFEYAKPGMISLQTVFAALAAAGLDTAAFVQMQSVNTRKIFGMEIPELKENTKASLTLFVPSAETIFAETSIRSKSKNSAFTGFTLKGKITATINGAHVFLNK